MLDTWIASQFGSLPLRPKIGIDGFTHMLLKGVWLCFLYGYGLKSLIKTKVHARNTRHYKRQARRNGYLNVQTGVHQE